MTEATITPEVAAASYVLHEDDDLVEAGVFHCGTCGEDFEPGQQALTVYAPWANIGKAKAVEAIHLRCYQGEEVSGA